ncbi:MAG: helicase HerA-like domain-containing protein [Thermoleophilia bacterium]
MSAFHDDMAAGYGFEGAAVRLGRPFQEATAPDLEVEVAIPLAFLNRHGLIAGATGTGKTRTLQLMAEQASAAGVPVFAADMKGDLAGLGAPGAADERVTARAAELATTWTPAGCPVELLSLTGDDGVPLRATVSGFGPVLLSKVLGLNDTQESSLSLIFRYCDEKGLALVDLEDLRAALAYLTGPGKAELRELGGISTSTAGVLLREVSQLEAEGGDVFFGEPELEVGDLIRLAPDGRGIVSILNLVDVARRPTIFSTFLMWVLAELFEHLPEVGDPEKPVLVFFFDEAHLLFADASDGFLEQVAQTVRLIRSKGVGVFFITQLPTDVPDNVLAQLGHRVQHAVRAFTPKDARALRTAVDTFPITTHYDLAETLQSLGVGEAAVTVLDPRGVPTPVAATRLYPPASRMTPLLPEERQAAIAASPLRPKYGTRLDRESAAELLAARTAGDAAAADEIRERERDREVEEVRRREAETERERSTTAARRRREPKPPETLAEQVQDMLGSKVGTQVTREVLRGIFGMLRKRR